jgi:hypothetical protein
LKPKRRFKRYLRVCGSGFSHVQYILFTLEENAIHQRSKPEVWSPTLIGLDVPLTTLVGITRKRKQLLTYTQETTRAKLERLYLARLIYGDQTTITRHAMALKKTNELISLLAPTLSTIKHVI